MDRELTRRTFLQVLGASGVVVVGGNLVLPHRALGAPSIGELTALRGAMHVHTCFSEGTASLHSQLEEASRNGFDLFWPSDHDWRMSAHDAPTTFHFTALQETVNTKNYTWKPATTGKLASSSGGIVSTPVSPHDPASSKGSLRVEAVSAGSAAASRRYLMDGGSSNKCHRTNLADQQIVLDVLLDQAGSNSWAEVLVNLSYRPATTGRAAGSYQISYRIGTAAASRTTQGLLGIVTVPLAVGEFGPVTLEPVADAASLWPDLVATDNALVDLRLGATSRGGAAARAFFGHLRFRRDAITGDEPLQTQADMVAQYAARYPGLTIGRAAEVSGTSEHANWFGGEQHLIDHATVNPPDLVAYASALVHQGGGLASLNHPFGSKGGAVVTEAQQTSKRRAAATKFLGRQLSGVDIVEAGFRQRGRVSLETHLALFDTFIRSGYWVTANGTNDNHAGTAGSWATESNRFYTTLWSASSSEPDLLAALRSGRAFVGELGAFQGYLSVDVEGNPMGSVSIKPGVTSRELTITGLQLPTSSTVEVVRGPVDYSNSVDPGTSVVTTLPASAFSSGEARMSVDTRTPSFLRVNVMNSAGRRVAFSNPIMLLQAEPVRPLPSYRRAPDSLV